MADLELPGGVVRVEPGLLDELGAVLSDVAPAFTYAIVTDANVAPHWLARVERSFTPGTRVISRVIPPGEVHKTRDTWTMLTDWLLASACGRDTTVVALGGGVVGDLAGFVAATYMRGVPVVQAPTSLLAMVDASIGGKTGVDTPAGKNLVGAFHPPIAVLVDPNALATLPVRETRAGVAEMVKHGAIADRGAFDSVARWAASMHDAFARGDEVPWHNADTVANVARSITIKAGIVRADPREGGRRQVLNAGHTLAHAIELATGFEVLHGEAVAIGLVAEAQLGEHLGVTSPGTAAALGAALGEAGLPVAVPAGLDPGLVVDAMRIDKKGRRGRMAFALLAEIGRVAGDESTGWTTLLDEDEVRGWIARVSGAAATASGTGV